MSIKPEYPPALAELLREPRVMPLGTGQSNESARPKLAALDVQSVGGDRPILDVEMARACLAGVWLYHDFLDEAHKLSQEITTPTGNYWHGIMHRREGDFSNAKYWFHRVGTHPIFEPLYDQMQEYGINSSMESGPGSQFILKESWDPFGFIDLVEAVARKRSRSEEFCRQVQMIEWRLLMEHCYRQAVGESS